MASKKIQAKKVKKAGQLSPDDVNGGWDDLLAAMRSDAPDDDSSLVTEDVREEGFWDGMYAASLILEGVLQDARCALENADLEPSADTAARMVIEQIARAFQREKEGV